MLAATCLIAGTYGLVRLAYGLFLPDIRDSLAMSSTVSGYVASGASLAYCGGALVGFLAAHRGRLLVLAALLTAGIGAGGMALAPNLEVFVPLAILGSSGAGLASPGLVDIIERDLPALRSPRAQATVNAGTGPGLVAAGLLASWLLPHWRLGFAVSGALTVAAGIAVLVVSRPRAVGADACASTRAGCEPARPRWSRTMVVPLAGAACGALLLGAASAVVWTYGRTHLIAEGASGSASTLAWIALGIGGTLTVVTAPATSRMPAARAWSLSSTTVAAAIAALGLQAASLPLALMSCLAFGWGFVAATSALIAWAAVLAPGRAASLTSLLFIAVVLGQAAGSGVAGTVADHLGLVSAFLLSAALAAVAAACGQRLTKDDHGNPAHRLRSRHHASAPPDPRGHPMYHRFAAPAVAVVLGASLVATAAPAQAATSWQTLSTIEDARFQTCKVSVSDGTAWRVRLRVLNRNDFWVQGRATILDGSSTTDRTWSSGRVAGGDTATGAVRAGRGDRWRLSHTFGAENFGGGGELRVADIRRC